MNVQMPKALSGDAGTAPVPLPGGASRAAGAVPANPAPTASTPSQTQKPSSEQIQQAVENLKRITQPIAQNLQFSVNQGTGETVIRVVDSSTNEVIRQIPSEEVLSLARELDKLSGLLLKQKA